MANAVLAVPSYMRQQKALIYINTQYTPIPTIA